MSKIIISLFAISQVFSFITLFQVDPTESQAKSSITTFTSSSLVISSRHQLNRSHTLCVTVLQFTLIIISSTQQQLPKIPKLKS